MTILSTLISEKNPVLDERNLVTGQAYSYVASAKPNNAVIQDGFCWSAPANGSVVLEMWGSGAGGATSCCCGGSVGGNSGAYAKKCFCVDAGNCICGNVHSGGTPNFCSGNCGCPACVCWQGRDSANGCIWVGGGRNGLATCSTGTSVFCCMVRAGMCFSYASGGCGLVCNYNASWELGCVCSNCTLDTCCVANIACADFYCNSGRIACGVKHFVALPPGMHGTGGSYAVWSPHSGIGAGLCWSSVGWINTLSAIDAISRFTKGGTPLTSCVGSNFPIGCFPDMCCHPFLPVGTGGTGGVTRASCRSSGKRGGPAAVRITFSAD